MKKKIIITIIILVVLLAAVGGGVIYTLMNPTRTDWGNRYYSELIRLQKEGVSYTTDENGNQIELHRDNLKNAENCKIQFIKKENNEIPMMYVTYELDNQKCVDRYEYLNDSKKLLLVDSPMADKNGVKTEKDVDYELKYVYSIEDKDYSWYTKKTDKNTGAVYYSDINYKKSFNFTKDEMTQNETNEEGIPQVNKFEESIVEVELENDGLIKLDNMQNLNPFEMKNVVNSGIKNYEKDLVTEEVKVATENKVKQVEEKKEQIRVAAEEKAKKEAEEKARIAAEEAAKGLQVGKYRIKYGTYKAVSPDNGSFMKSTITINQDNTFKLVEENGTTVTGTYKIESCNFSQDITPSYVQAIQLYKSNGQKYRAYTAWSSNVIGDNDIESFKYIGN